MDQVKIHTGTRIKLKRLEPGTLPADFEGRLQELLHGAELVQAAFVFVLETPEAPEQASLALGLKGGILSRGDAELRRIVEEIQLLLPPELPLKVFRLDASPVVRRYCLEQLEPLYLRSYAWLAKERRST